MKKVREILKKILFLSPMATLLIAVPSFIFVFWILAEEPENPWIVYTSYALSAYAAVITGTGIAGLIRWIREGIRKHPLIQKLLESSVVRRYLKEHIFRTEISLYSGLMINLLYAGIKLFSGIRYQSVWFGTLAVYYFLLAVLRFSLLNYLRKRGRSTKNNQWEELKRCRICGIVLMALDWALAGIIILAVTKNNGFAYPGMLIYLMALYTFYSVITAVMNVVKFRKYGSPVISAAKAVSLTAALVSMFSLETAMVTQFGDAKDASFRRDMSAATGTAVMMIVLALAGMMVLRTTIQIRRIKRQEEDLHDSDTGIGR